MEKVCHELKEIFELLQLQNDGTLPDFTAQAQNHLLRKAGQEKWELNSSRFDAIQEQLLPHLKNLGFVDEIIPTSGIYDYLVILGFVTIDVQRSFDFATKFLQSKDIECKNVVLLTSLLPLPVHSRYYEPRRTEADLMQWCYQNSLLATIPCTIINLPMLELDGQTRRPTTEDTVRAWLNTNPKSGNILMVSAQPFIQRQSCILRSIFPNSFQLNICGPSAEPHLPIALYLDELARALYQWQMTRNLKKRQ